MTTKRKDNELPLATVDWGWQYHHTGIPVKDPIPGERYIPHLKMYVAGFETSPYGIEWMRFEDDAPIHELIRTVPHVAFVVPDLEEALKGKDVLTGPESPSDNLRVAMIRHNGAPVELMEFEKTEEET